MYKYFQSQILVAVLLALTFAGCHSRPNTSNESIVQNINSIKKSDTLSCCSSNLPSRPFMQATDTVQNKSESSTKFKQDDMVFVPGGTYLMGGDSIWGRPDEFPRHKVKVSSFLYGQARSD